MQDVRFDVVLCDIALGAGIDGYEVARRLRSSTISDAALLVAVSGFGGDEDRTRAAAAGVDTSVSKPVELDDLARLLPPTASR